jgi:glycosyltransferase involved in cell wall biosynthesis
MVKNTKICFIALGAYPLLKGKEIKRIVGPDVHQVLLARGLMNQGFEVSIITYGEKEFYSTEYLEGIEVIKIWNYTYRLRVLDLMIKIFALLNALIKSKAHVYFQAGSVPGIVSLFCKFTKKKLVYEIASDAQVNRNVIKTKNREFSRSSLSLNSLGNWLDIKIADKVIVQTTSQKKDLMKNFKRDGKLIKMSFPISESEISEKEIPPFILWVGSMAEVKQPQLFLELARRVPEFKFQMIGGPSGDKKLYEMIKDNSKQISNLAFLGVVPFSEINEYFSKASILINTSMFEGFPNTFLQAWMHNTPVISLNADPDEIICEKKLGFHSRSFEQLVESLRNLCQNKQLLLEMGSNGRKYVEEEHDLKLNIYRYIEIFENITGGIHV